MTQLGKLKVNVGGSAAGDLAVLQTVVLLSLIFVSGNQSVLELCNSCTGLEGDGIETPIPSPRKPQSG